MGGRELNCRVDKDKKEVKRRDNWQKACKKKEGGKYQQPRSWLIKTKEISCAWVRSDSRVRRANARDKFSPLDSKNTPNSTVPYSRKPVFVFSYTEMSQWQIIISSQCVCVCVSALPISALLYCKVQLVLEDWISCAVDKGSNQMWCSFNGLFLEFLCWKTKGQRGHRGFHVWFLKYQIKVYTGLFTE